MNILSGSARQAALAFIFVTAMLDIVAMGIIIPVLPSLIEEFAGSNAAAGWYNGAFVALWAGMQFVASPVIGSLSDRYGRRPIVLLSTAGLAADYVLMALAPNLWWLALGRIIAGITSSSFTTVFAYMADITPPEGRARGYGLIGAAFSAGFVLGPLLGGVLGELSPRAPFWFAAAMSGSPSSTACWCCRNCSPSTSAWGFPGAARTRSGQSRCCARTPSCPGSPSSPSCCTSPTTSSRRCSFSMPPIATAGRPGRSAPCWPVPACSTWASRAYWWAPR